MKISSHRHENFEKVPTNHSKKLPYGCFSVKLELQRYEAEACYEDFLGHAEHNNLEIAYLARILREKCLSCKNLASSSFILQESCKMRYILQESCKMRYILQESCKMRYILQESESCKNLNLARNLPEKCIVLQDLATHLARFLQDLYFSN